MWPLTIFGVHFHMVIITFKNALRSDLPLYNILQHNFCMIYDVESLIHVKHSHSGARIGYYQGRRS